jgi:2-polyprenyl-3-methyl-5-hydroxy-6-metoxy-1,4-benzoquinol methylase
MGDRITTPTQATAVPTSRRVMRACTAAAIESPATSIDTSNGQNDCTELLGDDVYPKVVHAASSGEFFGSGKSWLHGRIYCVSSRAGSIGIYGRVNFALSEPVSPIHSERTLFSTSPSMSSAAHGQSSETSTPDSPSVSQNNNSNQPSSRPKKRSGRLPVNGYRSQNLNRYTTSSRIYRWHTDVFHDALLDLIDSATPSPQTILDAGCGEGYVSNLIAERNPQAKLTGIDASEGAISYAQANFGHAGTYQVASIFELPFPDGHFDLVLCSEVLEHLDDPMAALAELKRVSRRHVLITIPREPIFQFLNDVGKTLRLCGDPGHVNFWTKQDFQDVFGPQFSETDFSWKHTYQLMLAEI